MAGKHGNMPENAERSKDFFGTWKRLIRYIRKYLFVIVLALLFSFAGMILTLLGPMKLSELTNAITGSIIQNVDIDMAAITRLGAILIVLYVTGTLLSAAQFSSSIVLLRFLEAGRG